MSGFTLSNNHINNLNSGLIIFSLILAYWIPFQLFIFAYAVLGPLHYLTEISWLHKSNYFIKGKNDYLILVGLGLLAYVANFGLGSYQPEIVGLGTTAIFVAFVGAFCFLAFDKLLPKIIGIALAFAIGIYVFTYNLEIYQAYFIAIGVFIPTIIHVCVFTWFFMLYGSIKSKSVTGYISCVIFLIACAVIFIYTPDFKYTVSNFIATLYRDTFIVVNKTLMFVFGYSDLSIFESADKNQFVHLFFSKQGQMFTRFVAFIYLYHYLNWFSKTSVIKWHEISRDKLIIITTLWVLSVALYFYDYLLGFQILFTLSLMHVFLEFPLNFKTINTIAQKIIGKN
jgi:hypothetical protein